jgi:hypothetical protein
MDDWLPIASHGDSEEEVRAALEAQAAEFLVDIRRELRELNLSYGEIEALVIWVKGLQRQQIEHDLPGILRDMAITSGCASLH